MAVAQKRTNKGPADGRKKDASGGGSILAQNNPGGRNYLSLGSREEANDKRRGLARKSVEVAYAGSAKR